MSTSTLAKVAKLFVKAAIRFVASAPAPAVDRRIEVARWRPSPSSTGSLAFGSLSEPPHERLRQFATTMLVLLHQFPALASRTANCGTRRAFIDLGANDGQSLQWFEKNVAAVAEKPYTQVVAFEMNPAFKPVLKSILARLPGGELKRGELTRIRRYANNPKQQLADKLKKVEVKKKKAERAASVAAMRRLEGKPPAPNPDLHRCCSNPKCFCNTFWREEGDDASVGSLGSLGSKKTLGSEGSRRKQHF